MKKMILLYTAILTCLCLCGCGIQVRHQEPASIKQPVIETPDPAAARIEVSSSVPISEPAISPAPDAAPSPASEPAPVAVPSPVATQEEVPSAALSPDIPQDPYSPVAPSPVPTWEPASLSAPAPAPSASTSGTAGPEIVITKNPTSEALPVGGNTWFVAHAENTQTLTWLLVDPEGNLHSVPEAAALNPGLVLEVLEEDTIAVSNAPLSFNGWGIQARFDGYGKTAATYPAYVFVGDYINAYSILMEKYRAAKNAGITNYGEAHERDVSEWTIYSEHIGYALIDLDKNGIPELLITGINEENSSRSVLLDLYTFIIDHPVRVCMSTARGRYYLLSDNRIYYEGSGGASIEIHEFYYLEGKTLQFIERYFSFYDSQDFGPYFYHTTQNTDRFLDRKPDNYIERIPLSEFPAIREAFYAKMQYPALVQII